LWNGGLAHALALIDRHMDSLQRPDSPAGFLESGRGYLAGGGASGIGVEKRKPGWRVVFWGEDSASAEHRLDSVDSQKRTTAPTAMEKPR
jgi:hypothetical protein